ALVRPARFVNSAAEGRPLYAFDWDETLFNNQAMEFNAGADTMLRAAIAHGHVAIVTFNAGPLMPSLEALLGDDAEHVTVIQRVDFRREKLPFNKNTYIKLAMEHIEVRHGKVSRVHL